MTPSIVFIHGVSDIGGAERELLTILDQLPSFGFSVSVVCPREGPLSDELASRNVPTRIGVFPPWRKSSGLLKRREAVRTLRACVVDNHPSIVHVNDIWWVPQVLRAVKGTAFPVVAHVRQEIEPVKVHRYELHKADVVLAVSRQVQQALEQGGVSPGKVGTLHSGVDLSRFQDGVDRADVRRQFGIPDEAILLGTVANLFPRKGYDVMLQALPKVVSQYPNVQYLIIGRGDPDYEHQLRRIVQERKLDACVRFVGFQHDPSPLLSALDLYIHPALMEGFGIAVIEAMAMNKPVIATTTGGLPDIVVERETGCLVPPNDPQKLAQQIIEVIGQPERWSDLGWRGRLRVEKYFSVQTMMHNLTSAYRGVMGQGFPA